jgi:SPP1 family predicted phage head-tail adaptor
MIPAGTMKQRISIQTPSPTQDAAGQPIVAWGALAGGSNLPARVESVAGGETVRGRQVSAEATTLLTVRWLAGVTPEMRVLYEGRTLGIVRASDPDGGRRELRIECREVV